MAILIQQDLPAVQNGAAWERIQRQIALLVSTGKIDPSNPYRVYLTDCKPKRSTAQNNYLFGVVYKAISDLSGYSISEVHEIMRAQFGLQDIKEFGPNVVQYRRSTTTYTKQEMSEYLENVIKWAGENGIDVPPSGAIPDAVFIDLHHNGNIK